MSDIKTVLTYEEIRDLKIEHAIDNGDLDAFARAIERAVLAAATPGQVEDRKDAELLKSAKAAERFLDAISKYFSIADPQRKVLIDVKKSLSAAIAAAALKSASVSEQKGEAN